MRLSSFVLGVVVAASGMFFAMRGQPAPEATAPTPAGVPQDAMTAALSEERDGLKQSLSVARAETDELAVKLAEARQAKAEADKQRVAATVERPNRGTRVKVAMASELPEPTKTVSPDGGVTTPYFGYMPTRAFRAYRGIRPYRVGNEEDVPGTSAFCALDSTEWECRGTAIACRKDPMSDECLGGEAFCQRQPSAQLCVGTEAFCNARPDHGTCVGTAPWCLVNKGSPECRGTKQDCELTPRQDQCIGTKAYCDTQPDGRLCPAPE